MENENNENKIVTTSFRLPLSLRKRLKKVANDRDTDSTTVVRGLIDSWLSEDKGGEAVEPNRKQKKVHLDAYVVPSRRKHDDELRLLEFILDHGTKDDAAGIIVNLKNFVEAH